MAETPPRSVAAIVKASSEYLASKNAGEARSISEILLARLLNCRPMDLHLRSAEILAEKHLEAMRRGVRRVANGEPVQYVVGQWEFMGHIFKTDKRALIPRQETETLVLEVLSCEPLWRIARPAIVEVGTGTGCIVISLAIAHPNAVYLALDNDKSALELARENTSAHNLQSRIAFSYSDLSELLDPESVDAIVANLPYIPTAEYEKLPRHIRDHEPRSALDAGHTGLAVIEAVAQDASILLKPGASLFLEIGSDQGKRVAGILDSLGFTGIEIRKDLAGRDRVAKARQAD